MPAPRLLLKLHPQTNFAAVDRRANLRPLFETTGETRAFGLTADTAAWYLADVGDLGPSPWDAAHGQISAALGIDQSAILFAEPDLPQSYPDQNEVNRGGSPFAFGEQDCKFQDQYSDERKPGPGFAWHLRDEFSQLGSARAAVQFTDPGRTRIAHIDTGYDPNHTARPARMLRDLERNFVKEDGTPNDATDPNRMLRRPVLRSLPGWQAHAPGPCRRRRRTQGHPGRD